MSENHAAAVTKRAKAEGTFLRKYLCPHCQRWHVTSKPLIEEKKPEKKMIPIDQAPKDGRFIKAFDGERWTSVHYVNGKWIGRDGKTEFNNLEMYLEK